MVNDSYYCYVSTQIWSDDDVFCLYVYHCHVNSHHGSVISIWWIVNDVCVDVNDHCCDVYGIVNESVILIQMLIVSLWLIWTALLLFCLSRCLLRFVADLFRVLCRLIAG